MAEGELLGKVVHYFDRIGVAVIALQGPLRVGDQVHFLGRSTDFDQTIDSMQVEHQPVAESAAGSEVAARVRQRVRAGDAVYKIGTSA